MAPIVRHQSPSSTGGQQSRSTTFHTICMNPFLISLLLHVFEFMRVCWEICWRLLTSPTLSEAALVRLSIACLGLHILHPYIEAQPEVKLPWWFFGGIATATLTLTTLLLSMPYWIRLDQGEAIIVTALVCLFLLESLQPIMILSCVSLIIMRQVSLIAGIFVLGVLWGCITFTTYFIRCYAYQHMGHG